MAGEFKDRFHREKEKALFDIAYKTHVEDPHNYLGEVRAFLGQGGRLVMYSNHIAYDDPAVVGWMYWHYFNPHNERHIIIPASHYHMDPVRNPKFYRSGKLAEEVFDAEIFPLIQNYMVDNPEYGNYTREDADINHRAFFKRLKELGQGEKPADIMIFPEGHRSEDGVMGPIEEGMTLAGRLLQPSVYLPLGVYYKRGYSRDHMNGWLKGHVPHLSVGMPVFQTGRERPETPLLMYNLAMALPQPMRGQWG